MSKTIVFKKEFEDKLKKLKIKTKFVNNIKAYCKLRDRDLQKHIDRLNLQETWDHFTYWSFIWGETPEGYDYWNNINEL